MKTGMKTISALIAAAALFGGIQLFHGGAGQSVADEVTPSTSFRLVANGDEGDCAVTRGAAINNGLSLLTVAPWHSQQCPRSPLRPSQPAKACLTPTLRRP